MSLIGLAGAYFSAEGWQGPMSSMLALVLPPEMRNFVISLWQALGSMLEPAGNVLFSIYVMVGVPHGRATESYCPGDTFQFYHQSS